MPAQSMGFHAGTRSKTSLRTFINCVKSQMYTTSSKLNGKILSTREYICPFELFIKWCTSYTCESLILPVYETFPPIPMSVAPLSKKDFCRSLKKSRQGKGVDNLINILLDGRQSAFRNSGDNSNFITVYLEILNNLHCTYPHLRKGSYVPIFLVLLVTQKIWGFLIGYSTTNINNSKKR